MKSSKSPKTTKTKVPVSQKKAKEVSALSLELKDIYSPELEDEEDINITLGMDSSRDDEPRHGRGSEYYDDANTDEDEYADTGQGEFREASSRNY